MALLLRSHAELLHEGVEEAESCRGVDGLAKEAGAEAGVEVEDLALGNDVAGDGDGSGLGAGPRALAGELEADLDHVDGLDDCGGHHAGNAAVDEGKGAAHEGGMEEVGLDRDGIGRRLFGHLAG